MSISDNDEAEYIRPPDEVRCDTLIMCDRYIPTPEVQYQRELELALTKSLVEDMHYVDNEDEMLRTMETSKAEYEAEMNKYIDEIFQNEKTKRQQRFVNAKIQLRRLSQFDKGNQTHYTHLLELIHNYEEGYIEYAEYHDEMEYIYVNGLIKTMRLTKEERNDLCRFMWFSLEP